MKKLVGIILILAILILGGYYGMGMMTEHTLKKNIAMLDESNELLVRIEQYNRHWFTSKAILHWKLHVPQHMVKNKEGQVITIEAQDYDVQMPLTIFHGPIIFSNTGVHFGLGAADAQMTLPKVFADKFTTLFTNDSSKPEAHLKLFVNYLNRTYLQIEVPSFKLIAKEGSQKFEWEGLVNDIHLSSDFNHIDGTLALSGMRLVKDEIHLTVNHIDSDYDLHQTDIGLFLGKADLNLSSLEIANQNETLFDLEKFRAHSQTDVVDGLFQSEIQLSFDKLLTNDRQYGPGQLAMTLKNVDAQSLMRVNEQINKMQQGTDIEKQQALLMLFPELPRLVSKGAQLQISELNFGFPEGTLHTTLKLSLPNQSLNNPIDIAQKLKGEAKIEVPAALVQSIMEEALKQRLMKQSSLQQAMMRQMKESAKNVEVKAPDDKKNTIIIVDKSKELVQKENNGQMTVDPAIATSTELLQQAKTLATEKIAALIKEGALVVQGSSYLIELQLQNGQLLVNGKPFSAAMAPIV